MKTTCRHFWLIPEFVKFRTVFETDETVLGVNDAAEHRLFRKDPKRLSFDESDALRRSIVHLSESDTEDFFADRTSAAFV